MKGSAPIVLATAVLVGIAVFVFVQLHEGGGRLPTAEAACSDQAPRCLPRMDMTDTAGVTWTPAALAGKVVIVNVWATWCGPCAREIPDLAAVYAAHRDGGVVLLGLVADAVDDAELALFADAYGINYPIVRMNDDLSRAFGASALPTTFIYDRSGRMQYGRPGMLTREGLESELRRLLGD